MSKPAPVPLSQAAPAPARSQAETDAEMLNWLREQLGFAEDGDTRCDAEAVVTRFAELIEGRGTFRRATGTLKGAHKLAMAQMQFAQSVVRQLGGRTAPPAPAGE